MEEDSDLKLIEHRKMEEMRKRIKAAAPAPVKVEKTDREVVEKMLYDRGDEVLEAAYSFYPRETERLVGAGGSRRRWLAGSCCRFSGSWDSGSGSKPQSG